MAINNATAYGENNADVYTHGSADGNGSGQVAGTNCSTTSAQQAALAAGGSYEDKRAAAAGAGDTIEAGGSPRPAPIGTHHTPRPLGPPVHTTGPAPIPGSWTPPAPPRPSGTDPFSFLNDPNLSVEDKLSMLMAKLSTMFDDKMEQKLKQYAAASEAKLQDGGAGASAASPAASGATGATGLFDTIKNAIVEMVPGGQLAAQSVSFQDGIADKIASWITGKDVAAAKQQAAAGQSPGTTAAGAGQATVEDPQVLLEDIKRLDEMKQQTMNLITNLLKSSHDTSMAIIGNMR